MAKVDVKLTHPTWVHGAVRQPGEIVEMDPKIAAAFGEVQQTADEQQPEPPVKRKTRARKSED